MRTDDVRRVLLGTFVRPAEETGTGDSRVEAVYGYLIRHEDAVAVTAAALAHSAPLPVAPTWMERLLVFDPRRVVFAHDAAVWKPS